MEVEKGVYSFELPPITCDACVGQSIHVMWQYDNETGETTCARDYPPNCSCDFIMRPSRVGEASKLPTPEEALYIRHERDYDKCVEDICEAIDFNELRLGLVMGHSLLED